MIRIKQATSGAVIGFFATIIFTIVVHVMPLLGIPKVDLSREIASRLFGNIQKLYLIGHTIHYFNGIVLAVLYQFYGRKWLQQRIKKSDLKTGLFTGLIWSLAAYCLSLIFLGLIGRNNLLFSPGVLSLLLAHLIYGLIIGIFLDFEDSTVADSPLQG